MSASRFLIINCNGRQKSANISLRIEWLRRLLQAAHSECFCCQCPVVGAFKWQLWVPAACNAGSHSGTAREVIKKFVLANLKVRSPIEHIWSWKEHCLRADSSRSGSYLSWRTCCLHMPSWGKSISRSRNKDMVGPSHAPGSPTAMHPGLGVGDASSSWALQHPLLPRAPLPPRRVSTDPSGSQPLLPLPCCFTLPTVHPHAPLLPTVPRGCQGKAGRLNTELGLPQVGFAIMLSLSCPHAEHHWLQSAWTKLSAARAAQSLDSLHRKVYSYGSAWVKSQENRDPFLGSLSLIHCKFCRW